MVDPAATLSCNDLPEALQPGQSVVCSGSSVLYWAAIEAGSINTTSRQEPNDAKNRSTHIAESCIDRGSGFRLDNVLNFCVG